MPDISMIQSFPFNNPADATPAPTNLILPKSGPEPVFRDEPETLPIGERFEETLRVVNPGGVKDNLEGSEEMKELRNPDIE